MVVSIYLYCLFVLIFRVKSASQTSNNPFSNNSVLQTEKTNVSTAPKTKRDNQSPLQSFHLRQQKVEKSLGRVTPSLLTGRVTPLITHKTLAARNSSDKLTASTITSIEKAPLPITNTENTFTPLSNLAVPSLGEINKLCTRFKVVNRTPKKELIYYNVPSTLNIRPPVLPDNFLEPRLIDNVLEIVKESIKHEDDMALPNPLFTEDDHEIKIEHFPNQG